METYNTLTFQSVAELDGKYLHTTIRILGQNSDALRLDAEPDVLDEFFIGDIISTDGTLFSTGQRVIIYHRGDNGFIGINNSPEPEDLPVRITGLGGYQRFSGRDGGANEIPIKPRLKDVDSF